MSKNDPKQRAEKKREKFFVNGKEVKPVRLGRNMWWMDDTGILYKKWTERR